MSTIKKFTRQNFLFRKLRRASKFSLVAVLALALVLGTGGAANAATTFAVNAITETGALTISSSANTSALTVGTSTMTTGATTIYGGTGTGAITLTPGTAGTIQIGSGASGAVTITPATTITGALTANGGLIVASGQTLTVTGATITGLNATSAVNTPAGNIAAVNVQTALNELDTEKLALAGGTMTGTLAMGANNITGTGTIAATTFTGALTGNASGSAASFTGSLVGDVTGTQGATVVGNAAVIGKVLTGYTSGAGTVAATDSILGAIQKLNGNDALALPLTGGTMSGAISGLTGLTVASGGAAINGGLNNNSGGITNAGAISGVTTLTVLGVTTDITTGTDENLTLVANGVGVIDLNDSVIIGGAVTIGAAGTTGEIIIGQGTDDNTISIGKGATLDTKTQTINIGAGTPAGTGKTTITIGNIGGAGSLALNYGTGGLIVTPTPDTTVVQNELSFHLVPIAGGATTEVETFAGLRATATVVCTLNKTTTAAITSITADHIATPGQITFTFYAGAGVATNPGASTISCMFHNI